MQVAACASNNIRDLIETSISKLLTAAAQEFEGPSIAWERESRRAFEDAALPESQWSAWIDAWIDAAYEQAHVRLSAVDFESLTDWCTCGHSHAEHAFRCEHALTCGCEKFQRSRKKERPQVRVLTPNRWRESRVVGPDLNPLAEVI